MLLTASARILDVTLLCAALLFLWQLHKFRKVLRLPPGPKGVPFLGSALDFYSRDYLELFEEWTTRYGALAYFNILGTGVLLVGNQESAKECFTDRSSRFSDRPAFITLGELMDMNKSFALMPYGRKWKDNRKFIKAVVHPREVKKFTEDQNVAISHCIQSTLSSPTEFADHLRTAVSNVILSALYGTTTDGMFNEDIIADVTETMEIVSRCTVPGAFILELFPRLRHILFLVPFNNLSKLAAYGKAQIKRTVTKPFNYAKKGLIEGTIIRDSLVTSCIRNNLDRINDQAFNDDLIWTAGTMFGAGSETTYATTLVFVIAMAHHPDVQRKVKDEISRVMGVLGRIPTYEDRVHLPYLEATLKEALRWRPAVPIGLPRMCNADAHINGIWVPKDTIVLPNIWIMSRTIKSEFPADNFEPERFIPENGRDVDPDPFTYVFGIGKRICPGRHLLANTLFVFGVSLMSTIKVTTCNDNPIKYSTGLVRCPMDVSLSITSDNISPESCHSTDN